MYSRGMESWYGSLYSPKITKRRNKHNVSDCQKIDIKMWYYSK